MIFDKKDSCMLGEDLLKTGMLSPKARKKARKTLNEFALIAKEMEADLIVPIATAALREASDGRDFIRDIEADTGLILRVISGEEEARLSAIGVLSVMPEAQGIVADLGGGSLELAIVGKGKITKALSVPLGVLILQDLDAQLLPVIGQSLTAVPRAFIGAGPLYAVGGTFRAIGRMHMKLIHREAPLQGYTMSRSVLGEMFHIIRRETPEALSAKYKVPIRRARALPAASFLLEGLLDELEAPGMIVSTSGLRDGVLEEIYAQD
jgi:exopolyphosphatase/guanosine-5'-triphosphate,3'-diphosphate pyrophosphatase